MIITSDNNIIYLVIAVVYYSSDIYICSSIYIIVNTVYIYTEIIIVCMWTGVIIEYEKKNSGFIFEKDCNFDSHNSPDLIDALFSINYFSTNSGLIIINIISIEN